jgi:hypothetical protein
MQGRPQQRRRHTHEEGSSERRSRWREQRESSVEKQTELHQGLVQRGTSQAETGPQQRWVGLGYNSCRKLAALAATNCRALSCLAGDSNSLSLRTEVSNVVFAAVREVYRAEIRRAAAGTP